MQAQGFGQGLRGDLIPALQGLRGSGRGAGLHDYGAGDSLAVAVTPKLN